VASAVELGRRFFDLRAVPIHHVDQSDLEYAWRLFSSEAQRTWSFTDCTSRAIMERLHIKRALTFDRHFAEFGVVSVVP
jgi:hypothetical protein